MHRMLVAALFAAAVTAGSPAATAHHDTPPYTGECGFTMVDDGSGTGGDTQWLGEVSIVARTIDAAGVPTIEPIAVSCELYVDGYSRGIVASASGIGVVLHVEELSVRAHPAAVISLCTRAEVRGHAYVDCGGTDPPPPYPPTPILELLIDFLNEEVYPPVDAVACEVFKAYAGQYGPVLIDEGGDVYLFGDTQSEMWWDCPPYVYA